MDNIAHPRKYQKGKCMHTHLENMNKFFSQINAEETTKITYILNSLDENTQFELFGCHDYPTNDGNYDYIVKKLKVLFGTKKSLETTIIQLLKLRQKPTQSIREFCQK